MATHQVLLKPPQILDRDREWGALAESVERLRPGLNIVLGRRRVGKSFLLAKFVQASVGAYYQATRKTEREQLHDLSRVLAECFDDPALRRTALPDWDAIMGYVVEKTGLDPFVLVLDEFPYLVDAAPALPSILQRWWDHELEATRVNLVLSGSHISAMKRLVGNDQPLYGRRTGRIAIRPFDYLDAARFVPNWPAHDKMRLYSVFGGLPGHLELVDPDVTLAKNAARHVVSSSGRLHDEAAHAFDSFLADAAVHYSIVEAIASGQHRWSRIASRVGKQTSALARPLEWLLDMEVIERISPVTEYPRPSPKRNLYRLADPYLMFWHRFISDVKGRGLADLVEPIRIWDTMIAPRLDDQHVAGIFEEACRQFVSRGVHPSLPFRPIQVGTWWNSDSSAEVDVVAVDGEGGLLVGECKWGEIDAHDLDRLVQRGRLIAEEMNDIVRVAHILFSAGPVSDTSLKTRITSGEATHVSIEDMYLV